MYCSLCKINIVEVDIEVTNVQANETFSLTSCLSCASHIAFRSWCSIYKDIDNLYYTPLGVIGDNIELTN